MTGVAALIQHIKTNPSNLDAGSLSRQFSVDQSVVEAALARVTPKDQADAVPMFRRMKESLVSAWIKVTSKPIAFLVVTSLLSLVLMKGMALLPDSVVASWPKGVGPRIYGGVMLGAPLLHFAAFGRFGKFKYLFLGAGIYLLAILAALTNAKSFTTPGYWMMAMSLVALSVLYLIIGTPFIVYSKFRNVQRQKRAYESMSRQQLLERLLWVRQTLSTVTERPLATKSKLDVFLAKVEPLIFVITPVVSFATSAMMSIAMTTADPSRALIHSQGQMGDIRKQSTLLMMTMGLSLIVYVSQFLIGACNRTFRRLLLCVLLYGVGYVVAAAMPFAYISFGESGRIGWGNYAFGVILQCTMLVIGYLARIVYEHTVVDERRRNNDPQALTDELVELEWRLVPTSSQVTVLAVDVVGSTSMKRTADPLVAEWSFREYQSWVERVCATFGGKVHSTAGDGAIVGFEDPSQALQASIALTKGIDEFNATKNRLVDPFGIRIGLHSGEVQGDLGDVQFTRVIDIAAHIEGKAPVGGIAASEVALAKLDGSLFQKAAVTTDGHDVFVYTG